jgi:hypothetical protein
MLLVWLSPPSRKSLGLLQKKYVLSLKVGSSLGQTLNYWVDWHLLKLAQPARL